MEEMKEQEEQKSLLNVETSRRNFLRGTAAVAAGVTVGGLLTSCATAGRAAAIDDMADPLLEDLKAEALGRIINNPAINDMGVRFQTDRWIYLGNHWTWEGRQIVPPFRNFAGEKLADEPLWGVVAGNDHIWHEFQKNAVIGPFHMTPLQAFLYAFPNETNVRSSDLSVLSWVLPKTRAAIAENAAQPVNPGMPGDLWGIARQVGEVTINKGIMTELVKYLEERGIQAAAPEFLPEFRSANPGNKWTFASNWSHRHVAFAAGHGTFGLSDGLITKVGKAHRVGSIVIRARMKPTPRTYTSNRAYCLYFKDGSCAQCVARCPVNSVRKLEDGGRNKVPCQNHLLLGTPPGTPNSTRAHLNERLGINAHGCGLCQTGVLCATRIPIGVLPPVDA